MNMRRIQHWFHGLMGGIIGGAATSGCAWLGMSAAHSAGVDVPVLNLNSLGIILLSGAIASGLAYLKQSPLPPEDDEEPPKAGTIAAALFLALLVCSTGCMSSKWARLIPENKDADIDITVPTPWGLQKAIIHTRVDPAGTNPLPPLPKP